LRNNCVARNKRRGVSFTDALGQVGLGGAGIPEPGTLGLLVLGAGDVYAAGRRKRFGGGGGSARNDGMYDGTLGDAQYAGRDGEVVGAGRRAREGKISV